MAQRGDFPWHQTSSQFADLLAEYQEHENEILFCWFRWWLLVCSLVLLEINT